MKNKYENESVVLKPQNVRLSCALVIRAKDEEFQRLLAFLETELPECPLVYMTQSVGRLWIMRGEPPREQQ